MEMVSKYLDRRILKTPAIAIEAARQEVLRMAAIARAMIAETVDVFLKRRIFIKTTLVCSVPVVVDN